MNRKFFGLIDQISERVEAQLNQANSNEFEVALAYAIKFWCNYLEAHPRLNVLFTSEVTYHILSLCGQEPMPQLTYNIYQEWRGDKEASSGLIPNPLEVPTGLSLLINRIFKLLKITDSDLNFIGEHPIFVIRQFNTMHTLREKQSRINLNIYSIQ
ncbi:hypothetical protein [Gloeothece verrucosa]|uniref:Uncharacterized protein n=1 Tax=Gloeothece verrucosa (strain PCC 7822) TaxID=497965 RepID=E0UN10_GLOV7|nr:hypothetical protein [Gloeothece verrucosa]ADN18340.1 hypothetical protein Cyan7822_6582 [Gloeothece verrucosa PCC 7822]